MSKKKQVTSDIVLNMIGTAVPLVILQAVIFPLMARHMTGEDYGLMQSLMSTVYLTSGVLGASLSTLRLVEKYRYDEAGVEGDFQALFAMSLVAIAVVNPLIVVLMLGNVGLANMLLVVLVCAMNCAVNYYEVGFRLEINFKRILVSRMIAGVGYCVGYGVFLVTSFWQPVYLCAFVLQIAYYARRSSIVTEGLRISRLFGSTVRSFGALIVANFMSRSLTYVDKILLYPLLGGTAVSIYFTANLLGKLVLNALEPVNNVILSYLARRSEVGKQTWRQALVVGVVVCAAAYILCLLVSRPIIYFFYPKWAPDAMPFIPLTTFTLCVSALSSFLYPFSLKTLSMGKQVVINGSSLAVYLALVAILIGSHGLFGACLALMGSYVARLLVMLALCFHTLRGER